MQAILQYLNQFHCRFISVCAETCRLRWLLIRRRQLAAAFWRRHLSVDICRRRLQPKLHVAAVYWLSINEKNRWTDEHHAITYMLTARSAQCQQFTIFSISSTDL